MKKWVSVPLRGLVVFNMDDFAYDRKIINTVSVPLRGLVVFNPRKEIETNDLQTRFRPLAGISCF